MSALIARWIVTAPLVTANVLRVLILANESEVYNWQLIADETKKTG